MDVLPLPATSPHRFEDPPLGALLAVDSLGVLEVGGHPAGLKADGKVQKLCASLAAMSP